MQTFAAKDGRFNRDNFFGQNEELARLVEGMTDEQIDTIWSRFTRLTQRLRPIQVSRP